MRCHEWIHKKYAPSRFTTVDNVELSEVQRRRAEIGIQHEEKLLDQLAQVLGDQFLRINDEDAERQTWQVLSSAELTVVSGAVLGQFAEISAGISPTGRIGKPDLLIRDSDGWIPVDVKSHRSIEDGAKEYCSSLPLAELVGDFQGRAEVNKGKLRLTDALQLAHYWQQLRDIGFASNSELVGIIGSDGATIALQSIKTLAYNRDKQCALEIYTEAFREAVEVKRNASLREQDSTVLPVAFPRYDLDCKQCEFKNACMDEMFNWPGGGHPTLIPGLTPKLWRDKYPELQSINDVAALDATDTKTVELATKAKSWLTREVLPLKSREELTIPEFDIEIDIDLENSQATLFGEDTELMDVLDVVFQYGWILQDRLGDENWRNSVTGVFEEFSNTLEAERIVLTGMWQWCQQQVADAKEQGRTIGFFHYSNHEIGWWRKFAQRHAGHPDVPTEDEVEDFVSTYMFDLEKTARQFAFPAKSYSIKDLAPLSGFNWGMDDAGGDTATLKFITAMDARNPVAQREAQEWLTSYNRDDVRATMSLRNWLRTVLNEIQAGPATSGN